MGLKSPRRPINTEKKINVPPKRSIVSEASDMDSGRIEDILFGQGRLGEPIKESLLRILMATMMSSMAEVP